MANVRLLRIWLALCLALIVWMGATIVRIENERYALLTGLCKIDVTAPATGFACLARTETRTSWWWHLYYAMK